MAYSGGQYYDQGVKQSKAKDGYYAGIQTGGNTNWIQGNGYKYSYTNSGGFQIVFEDGTTFTDVNATPGQNGAWSGDKIAQYYVQKYTPEPKVSEEAAVSCSACDSCNATCQKDDTWTQQTKQGCTTLYGLCVGIEDKCNNCQGCEACQSMDKTEEAQSSLIKNVDEAVTRRARGEGYSKAAANMIGGGSAQDATAQNFNSLAMQQNQAGNTTQADWLNKQGYLDALDQEIKNKKASQGLETVGAFFNF